jgi:hypothetical protein
MLLGIAHGKPKSLARFAWIDLQLGAQLLEGDHFDLCRFVVHRSSSDKCGRSLLR